MAAEEADVDIEGDVGIGFDERALGKLQVRQGKREQETICWARVSRRLGRRRARRLVPSPAGGTVTWVSGTPMSLSPFVGCYEGTDFAASRCWSSSHMEFRDMVPPENQKNEENRAVIEKMLLEEEYPLIIMRKVQVSGYYLSKKSLPDKVWLDQKEDDKKYVKRVHSPTKPASYSVKWTIEEKELFEQGLMISPVKHDCLACESNTRAKFGRRWTKISKLIGSRTVLQVKSYARQGRADPNLNAVKIEKLSDDEEVDITDEVDELSSQTPQKNSSSVISLDFPNSKMHETNQGEFIASDSQEAVFSKSSRDCLQNEKQDETLPSSEITLWTQKQSSSDKNSVKLNDQKFNELIKNSNMHDGRGIIVDARQLPSPGPCEIQKDLNDNEMPFHSCQMVEESHEEEELKPPEQEIEIDRNIIQEEEKQAIPEFFEGRQAKTPERYLKIRNYILDQWPQTVDKVRIRDRKDAVEAYQLAQRLQSMRTRRRRVRDPWGNWCDAKDLEGQTFEEPFQVKVASEALLIMDLHAHVSMAEVIGLLGGRYSEVDKVVEVCAAEPCNSLSTGLQCEMDPVSQTQASETLAVRGYSVIGWYHSHPAFDPNPSLRDIDTQAKYQSYFSRGGAKFIGMIVSPYNRNNPLPYSQITCLVISEEISPDGSYRLPYKFEVQQMLEEPQWGLVFEKTRWIIEKYRLSHSSVPMDKIFHRDSDLTCLQKGVIGKIAVMTLSPSPNTTIPEEAFAIPTKRIAVSTVTDL
ncbi:Myb-like, SWIRM and MPN domains 1 [Saguinus oedipus]|uniref:Myb-like, SWIRM and MPN domain-containing protein 1 n=1 Tax=Saguinus oedipus TaxID=9490 RepID=A0ABQ9VF56_SAGOE|nr:Myb-like, SWIRM and MPN domains 1 [Saguinus oedipus]